MMEVESSFSMRDQITAAALAKKKLLRRFSVGSVLSRSRTIRKLRKVFLVVLLHVYLTKRLAELRWGQFVESQDNLLLHTSRKEVPQHYLDGLGGCPLPPGWVASVLPAPLRNQILTYAKNKIVNLLTPVAKRRCYRSQILQLRQSMMQSATPVTDTMLKKASPMFEAAWTPAAIDDLMRCGTCVAYKQNMWVQQPTKSAYYPVNGMFLMSGTVVEVTLVPQEQTHNHHHIHQTADGKTPLTLQTHRELTAPCMLCETRFVLQSTSRVGYFARTNVLVMEYPYRDLGRITAELLQSPQRDRLRKYLTNARSQHMMSALPLRVDQLQRCTFFQKVAEADLQLVCAAARPRVAFERDVLCTQGSTVPEMLIVCRGALSVLLADPNAASGVTAAAAGGHPPPPPPLSPTSGAPPVALRSHSISPSSGLPHANQRALSSSAASTALPHSRAAAQQCMTLDAGMDFGGDHLIFEDRASVWVQCPAHTTTEYWCISSAALHGALKNTTQRKLMADAAAQSRAAFMRRSMSAATLRGLWLQYLPVLRRLEQAVLLSPSAELQPQLEQVFRDLLAASNAVVWKPGDRLVNVGDEIASAVLLQSGRLHRLVLQGTENNNNNNNSAKQQQQPSSPRGTSGSDSPVKKFVRKRLGGGGGGAEGSEDDPMRMTAPCILGETFLGRVQRWNASLTAARVCEGWTLHRNDVYRILRQWPELLAVMRSVVQASHNSNSSNHHHGSSHHHHHSNSHHHHAATTTTTTAHPQHEPQQMGTKSAVTFASVLPMKGSGGEGPPPQPRPSIFVPNAVSAAGDHNPHSTPSAAGGGKERQLMSSGVVSPLSLSVLESQSQSQQQHLSSYHETAPNATTTEEGGGGGSGGWKPSVPHAPKLRSGGRATIHERRATERKHREDAVVEAALAVTQRRARRLAPPPNDRVPFHSYEGLHPVQPSSVESYHAVRRSAQRQQTSSASPRRPTHPDHALASSSTVDGGSLQQQQQQQLLLRAASSVARPKTASAALPGSSSITAGGSTTTPTAAATGMNTVSGSTAAPTATTTTTTVREMLQAEVENMTLRQRRKRMAASLLSGANISSSPSVSGGSAQQLDASTASGGVIGAKAAKAVLKRILSTHKEQVAQRREQCKDALTVAKQTNAFSSLQQPSAPLPRLSPLGELYLQSPKKAANSNSSSSNNNNNHKRLPPDAVWHKTVPTSYLSAHAFSDI